MAAKKNEAKVAKTPRRKGKEPPRTDASLEKEMIGLAMDLALERLRDGTASNQLLLHFLNLGSSREKLEQDMLRTKAENLEAKTESIKSTAKSDELYQKAIQALKEYSGQNTYEDVQ